MKVFISHSSQDKKFVRTLKEALWENSIDTWVDEDELNIGDSLISKLNKALDESSHLVIVLSPSSIESEWVNFELKRALGNIRTGLTNKIIPIKYRECNVPDSLSDILYADLSKEIVLPTDNRVRFISNGFEAFFLKLVKALRDSLKIIRQEEKQEILKSIQASDEEAEEFARTIHRGNYELKGFTTKESRTKYQTKISKKIKESKDIDLYCPFLLPPGVKHVFNPKIGDIVKFEDEYFLSSEGYFAGFRSDDLAITIDRRIREQLNIITHDYYQVEIDPEKKTIKFIGQIFKDKKK